MVDKSAICTKYLKTLGRPLSVERVDGSEDIIFAVLQQLWRKNKSKFADIEHEIGSVYNEYYHYIGPANYDVTKLTKNDFVICDDVKYYFLRTDKIKIGNKVQYYFGILKRVWEDDENAFI